MTTPRPPAYSRVGSCQPASRLLRARFRRPSRQVCQSASNLFAGRHRVMRGAGQMPPQSPLPPAAPKAPCAKFKRFKPIVTRRRVRDATCAGWPLSAWQEAAVQVCVFAQVRAPDRLMIHCSELILVPVSRTGESFCDSRWAPLAGTPSACYGRRFGRQTISANVLTGQPTERVGGCQGGEAAESSVRGESLEGAVSRKGAQERGLELV